MNDRRPSPIDLVIDTSAIMAIALDEAPANDVRSVLVASRGPVVSAATLVELTIVATARFGVGGPPAVRVVLDRADVVTIPVDEHQAELALGAWQRFGNGRHPAGLNYGDCFTYALAKHLEVPLLCVGDHFAQTDVELARS